MAAQLLVALTRLGLREVVAAPGSRSQALALAAAALERAGRLRLRVRLDERGAGFLALGIGIESGRAAAVITTSGTAAANLHPAVLEAHHAGVPLLLLTADRPAELRGIGANQTTAQAHLFGAATRLSLDVDAGELDATAIAELAQRVWTAAVRSRGPVQLNLAFREPLSAPLPEPLPEELLEEPIDPAAVPAAEASAPGAVLELAPRAGTLVIAGSGAGPAAEEAAHALQAPLLAEVASGARFGRNLVAPYRRLLRDPELAAGVRRVIVFGRPTLAREVPALIERDGVETIVVEGPGAERYNPGHRVAAFTGGIVALEPAEQESPALRTWLGTWVGAARALLAAEDDTPAPDLEAGHSDDRAERARFARAELAAVRAPVSRRQLVEAVWRASWPHDRLVLGASRLIREADEQLPGKRIPVHANRGLAGIDGTVATGIGVALASQAGGERTASGVTRVLLGDLALLHDAGSMLFGSGERRPRIQLIVGDDHGGSLFELLEVAGTARPDDFDRVLRTPQRVSFAALAEGYDWEHRLAPTRGELERALTAAADRPVLIEVPLAG